MSASILSNEIICDLHGNPLHADGSAVLRALDRMLTVGSYYSRQHSQYLRAAEEACQTIVQALAGRSALALEIAANGLLIEGQTVDPRHRNVRQLHDLLVPLNIARLEISAALTPEDLRQALSALHDHRLNLGQAQGFREVTIENLPSTVSTASRTVGRGGEADDSVRLDTLLGGWSDEVFTPDVGATEGDREPRTHELRTHELRTLVARLLEQMKAVADAAGPAGESARATAQEQAGIREHLRELLASPIEATLDPAELGRLVELARSALALGSDPVRAELAFRSLRRVLEGAGAAGAAAASAPVLPPLPEDLRFGVEQLTAAVNDLMAVGAPLSAPASSARIDQFSIAFLLISAQPDGPLPVSALEALEEAWSAEGCGPDEVKLAAGAITALATALTDVQVDRLVPPVMDGLRRRRPDLVAPLWWEVVSALRPLEPTDGRWTALWPHLVNDLLLGLEPAPHPLTQPLYLHAGELDLDGALPLARRFAALGAVSGENTTGELFQAPVEKVRAVHAVLMRTAAADHHGPHLHAALARRSPDVLTRLLAAAVGAYAPGHRDMYVTLLRESGRGAHSAKMEEMAAVILQRALVETPPGRRDEAWVAPAVEWLRRSAPQAAAPLLKRIAGERRLLFLRAWPPACRRAATAPAGTPTANGES